MLKIAKYPKYKPAWNIEFYKVVDRVDLEVEETQASREVIDLYSEIEDFAGIVFVLDNLNKIIWTWCSRYVKSRGWAKKIIKEKDPKKVAQLVLKHLSEELEADFSDYKVAKVMEGDHPNEFEELFLYDVVDYNLYTRHYYKPEYQHLYDYADEEEEPKTKKCPACGWIYSAEKDKCPICGGKGLKGNAAEVLKKKLLEKEGSAGNNGGNSAKG